MSMERDENPWEALASYSNGVKRFLICLTRDADLAEELTQETLYQAVKSIHRYRGGCKMSVWLCQIAKHLYYDHLKKAKRAAAVPLEECPELPAAHSAPEELLLQAEARAGLRAAVNTLEEPSRSVFLLRAVGEQPFSEIGAVFEKSGNWARVTYYRARLKLMERIRGGHDEV